MINAKEYLKGLLNNQEIFAKLGKNGKIYATYPNEVTVFPCIIFSEENQFDTGFSDNFPEGSEVKARIHIYTKTNSGLPTTWEIGEVVYSIFRNDYWSCVYNSEMSDVEDNVRHRVMDFRKEFYS